MIAFLRRIIVESLALFSRDGAHDENDGYHAIVLVGVALEKRK